MSYDLRTRSYCDLHSIEQVKDLNLYCDFRLPQYRREVFLRFYEFHLKYKAHPGAVYYMFPYIQKTFNLTGEEMLWLAYINGCSQNIITSFRIFLNFPSIKNIDMNSFNKWFREHYDKLGWDTDRRYVKNSFPKCIENYKALLKGDSQVNFFSELCNDTTYLKQFKDFDNVWSFVINHFELFGRLSTFSYLEYLSIIGLDIKCNSLFLDDISGSKSHRNGLCKVLGRDDLDWHDSNPNFDGKYSSEIIKWLNKEAYQILAEMESRTDSKDLGLFTLESTLCCYKSWFRKDRRYVNVYNDMFFKRIKYAEEKWNESLDYCWNARKEILPDYLRLECNPNDPTHNQVGLSKIKQNHFRLTGEIPMLNYEYPSLTNKFNEEFYDKRSALTPFFE